MTDEKVVLVTGGAGSLGSVIVSKLLAMDWVKAVRVLDNDEYALFNLTHSLAEHREKLRLLLGDVRDRERIQLAMQGAHYVIHTAALKNLDVTEAYNNTREVLKTNIDGTGNMVDIALENHTLEKFLFTSSDKSVNPRSIYGISKAAGERLVLEANRISPFPKFACTRYGNIMESRGNIFDKWAKQRSLREPITITDPDSTRFFWHVGEAADFTIGALQRMEGGEVFIPKMVKVRIGDLAFKVTGLRENEKMHEELMTADEQAKAKEEDGYWVVR